VDEHVQIDLRRIIGSENPGLLRLLPDALIRILERLVHVRELNRGLRLIGDKEGVAFARGTIELLGARVETIGEQWIAGTARPLIVANHPLGGLDGLALIDVVGRHFDLVILPVNDLLMNIPHLRPVFVPINKHGSNRQYQHEFNQAFERAEAVVHFPAGLCSRKKGGRIRDLEWQKSFLSRARKNGRTVIPTYIDGANSSFFYNLARLRRWTGIPFNIEMIFLVDEMFKQKDKTIRITFGKPLPTSAVEEMDDPWKRALEIKRHVYRLAEDPDAEFIPEN
jgi:putative hemolysin